MYKSEFLDLVRKANTGSTSFYKNESKSQLPNPYFIGFGNPEAQILLVGKEKGFNAKKPGQLFDESINNPSEWSYHIKKGNQYSINQYEGKSEHYLSSFHPYLGKLSSGHTWTKYNKLLEFTQETELNNNGFLEHAFITEVNFRPSERSEIRRFRNSEREKFLAHPFYKSFEFVVLACGDYLGKQQIESIYDVEFERSYSKPRQKLEVYRNKNLVVLNTRQLSMDVKHDYLNSIAQMIRVCEKQHTAIQSIQ
jgi:hypothetical protein